MSSQRPIHFNLLFSGITLYGRSLLLSTVLFLVHISLWSMGVPILVYVKNTFKLQGICNWLLFFDIFQIKKYLWPHNFYLPLCLWSTRAPIPVHMTNAFKFLWKCKFLNIIQIKLIFISFYIYVVIIFYLPLCRNCIFLIWI
jgi:hypothetical protein